MRLADTNRREVLRRLGLPLSAGGVRRCIRGKTSPDTPLLPIILPLHLVRLIMCLPTHTLLLLLFSFLNNPSDSPNSIRRPATLTARNSFAIAAFVGVVQQLRRDLAGPQRVISCCFA